MGRLTEKDEQGNWCVKGLPWDMLHEGQVISRNVNQKLYRCLYKLMRYEDTGVDPYDVEELIAITEDDKTKKWIPCNERLPAVCRDVIICRRDGRVEQGMRNVNGWWKVRGTNIKSVVAWQPLPEPYMKKEE